MTLVPPQVLWAQRDNLVYVTVCLEDCKNPEIKLDNEKLYFKGKGGTDNKEHEVTLNFCEKVKASESKYDIKDRYTEFVIFKEEEKWWPRLLNENKKFHWLKVDFNKWKDEDDSGDEANDNSYESMMKQLGAGGAPDFGNFDMDDKEDSDEEQLPELE